jgi:hypothetical protein
MPTSAWASAGASLTPSPTIATCALMELGHRSRLVAGEYLGQHLVDPELGAIRSAVWRLSPMSVRGRTPSSVSAVTASIAVVHGRFIASATSSVHL